MKLSGVTTPSLFNKLISRPTFSRSPSNQNRQDVLCDPWSTDDQVPGSSERQVERPFSAQIWLYQRSGVDGELSLPSKIRPAIYQPQPWPPPFCSGATQKKRNRKAHLNYYASAYNRGFVNWSLTSPFSTNMAISEIKRSGVESYSYPVKEGQQYINLNPGHLFVQQPPKKGRDQEAHLNYYASTARLN